jgi:hypothetical protein
VIAGKSRLDIGAVGLAAVQGLLVAVLPARRLANKGVNYWAR